VQSLADKTRGQTTHERDDLSNPFAEPEPTRKASVEELKLAVAGSARERAGETESKPAAKVELAEAKPEAAVGVEEKKAEEPKVEAAKPVEEKKAEEPKVEAPKPVEEKKAEEPKVEAKPEAKVEEKK